MEGLILSNPKGMLKSSGTQEKGKAYITGNTPTTKDMEDILIPDYQRTNNLAMLCIYVVVAIAFRSLLMPVVAMIPIMMAIYLNMSFPYHYRKFLSQSFSCHSCR